MTIYALCPNCGKTLVDTGEQRFIECASCGRIVPSRVYGVKFPEGGSASDEAEVFYGLESEARMPRRPVAENKLDFLGPIRTLGSVLCLITIVIFIIILFINFIAFFPALVVTAPELVKEHHNDIRTELPLVIDDTPPLITGLQNFSGNYFAGQVVDFNVSISEPYLKEGFVEIDLNNSIKQDAPTKYNLKSSSPVNKYITSFQAPIEIGTHQMVIIAEDYAGNVAIKRLDFEVISSPTPVLLLTHPLDYSIINSSDILEFSRTIGNVTEVTYSLDQNIEKIPLFPPYSISTSNWSEGQHQLNLTIRSTNGASGYQNYSIYIDDSEPVLSSLSIEPLTIGRNDTFLQRLNASKAEFYRGEFVDLKLKIIEDTPGNAQVLFENRTFGLVQAIDELEPSTHGTTFQSIFPLPKNPDKYHLKIICSDLAGNVKTLRKEITVARINLNYYPVPILNLSTSGPGKSLSLPYINSSAQLTLPLDYGDFESLNYTTASGTSTTQLNYSESLNLTGQPEGEGIIGIHARGYYHSWDYLFFSLPIPPFLFVLPFVLTGWSLFAFYILIALAIILSNMYLFKSSFKNVIGQLKAAAAKGRAPMMESKNSMIMLAQLFLAVFSFSWIFYQVLSFAQVPTRTPDFSSLSTWLYIYNLTSAAVYEEVISRVLLIGLPLFIIHALIGKLKRPKFKYLLGGGFETNKLTIFLIIFSSLTFGLAHAPGWDYWKVIPTFISGFALGYLFVRKGIFAAILLHFSINFLTIPLKLLNYPLVLNLIYFFIIMLFIGVGIIYFGYYFTRVVKLFTPSRVRKSYS
ncbi:CPBP family intramembrane glutamic endopeptidase [[Eubacterium] cellulosolvens]